jgi:hypothetical protein
MSMVRFAPISVLFALGLSPIVQAQSGGFEGVVVSKMTGSGEGAEMTQYYKGTKTRTEVSSKGQGAVMIMDLADGTMTTLVPAQKMYMVMDFRKMGEALRGVAPPKEQPSGRAAGAPEKVPEIKATGRTETVAGHTCEWYAFGSNGDTQICSAKGLGFFMWGQSPMGRGSATSSALAALGANSDLARLFKDGFFPLKMMRVEGGKTQTLMEVTSVERKSLDAALFAIPPGYTEMKMPFGR